MALVVSPRAVPRYIRQYGYAFSWRRLWNAAKVIASMGLSWSLRRPIVWGRPFMLMVEPTNLCNLKCPLCPSGNGEMSRERGNMDLGHYRKLIDETGDDLVLLLLWNQGEPFINKGLAEMIRYAHDKRIPTITSTNGHFVRTREEALELVDSGLDEIIISLDGVDQETYERYRVGGKLERVLGAARLLAAAKRERGSPTPLVNLQFIVFRHNEEDLTEAERLARELEADQFLVKTAQVYSPEDAATFLPEQDLYRRYEGLEENGRPAGGEGDGLRVKGQPARGCKVLWYSSMVNWNGDVAPCCFDKDVDYRLGNAFSADAANGHGGTFGEAWRSRAYADFRRTVHGDRGAVDMCRNCSEGYRGMFSLVKELRG